jgi:hypothetical protein
MRSLGGKEAHILLAQSNRACNIFSFAVFGFLKGFLFSLFQPHGEGKMGIR